MTETLSDTCCEFEQRVSQLISKCQGMLETADKFEGHLRSYALGRLILKLMFIALTVTVETVSHYRIHEWQGCVRIFLRPIEGTTIYWLQKPELAANKALLATIGYEVLEPEEFNRRILMMIKELDLANWAESVKWQNDYGCLRVGQQYNSVFGWHMLL